MKNNDGNAGGAKFRLTDLMMLGVVTGWGVNMSMIKIGLNEMPAYAFNAVRLSLGALAFAVILIFTPSGFRLRRGDFLKTVGLGLLGYTLYQATFIEAIAVMNASTAAIISALSPIFIALLSTAVGQERIHWAGWLGIGVSFAGFVILASGGAGGAGLTPQSLKGYVCLLLSNTCWACYTVFARPILERNSPLKVSALASITGTILYLPLAAGQLRHFDIRAVRPLGLAAIAYSGLIGITLCFFLWYVSLKAVGSAKTGVYSNLTPIIAAVAAFLFLGEKLTSMEIVGAVVILAGVYLTRSGYRFFIRNGRAAADADPGQ